MSQRQKQNLEKPLTEVELQVMNAIWNLGVCTVKEVQLEILKTRELAYTSIATMMKILEQKKVIKSSKSDKAHTYTSLLSKEDYETTTLRHLSENLFKGDPSSMVMRLINDPNLSKEELFNIQKILNERIKS